MFKQIKIANKIIDYQIKTSPSAKRLSLKVYINGEVVISKPRYLSNRVAEKIIKEKSAWIIEKLTLVRKVFNTDLPGNYDLDKEKARKLIKTRLEYFSGLYGFKYQRLSIRKQKTRWGSCSKLGNLNFNYRLLYLSSDLRDYIIIHELCHLREFNHSQQFWQLVAQIIPDYQRIRRELKGMKR